MIKKILSILKALFKKEKIDKKLSIQENMQQIESGLELGGFNDILIN